MKLFLSSLLAFMVTSLPAAEIPPAAVVTPPGPTPAPGSITMGAVAPEYPVAYAPASEKDVKSVLDRVLRYLETASPILVVDQSTGQKVSDLSELPGRVSLESGDFQIISYEWGVTYAGMLLASEVSGDAGFAEFTGRRLDAIRALATHLGTVSEAELRAKKSSIRSVLYPKALDDSGSMAAAMIKAQQAKVGGELRPLIDRYLTYISTVQMRLSDGTLARNRPLPKSLWLDDLFMSVPALARMAQLTGEAKYFDDAVKQIAQFSQRMFVMEKGLYMHGWVEGMKDHPRFYWARANGWALMAMTELLTVLPENHPGYPTVLAQFREHMRGIAAAQGIHGLWHQLLDHAETYEETSASAIYVYCLARGINRGWIDAFAYGPATSLGWNAVAEKVNAQGQVTSDCVGTGIGWDPMYYAYRPTSVYAAHGYGPVLLAGAEMITLRRGKGTEAANHDGGVQFGKAEKE